MIAFKRYVQILVMVSLFHYLGRTISAVDDNWPEVVANLLKALKV